MPSDEQEVLLDQNGRAPAPIACDAARLGPPDIGTVDVLARLALTARRLGRPFVLLDPPTDLCELLTFAGLAEVLACRAASGVEVGRQPEEREEPLGVEEERDRGQPVAPEFEDLE